MPVPKPDAPAASTPSDTLQLPAEVIALDDETRDETNPEKKFVLRLDEEHVAALERLCKHERIKTNALLKKLIRLADQVISGEKSPFKSLDLEIHRKVG